MRIFPLFSLLASVCFAQISVTFVFGPQTPANLRSQVLRSLDSDLFEDYQFEYFTAHSNEIPNIDSDFIVNFTNSVTLKSLLFLMAQRFDSVLLQPSIPSDSDIYSSHILYTHAPFTSHSRALFLLLQALSWDSFFTTASSAPLSQQFASSFWNILKHEDASLKEFQVFSDGSAQSHFDQYIAEEVKITGNWKLVVLNAENGGEKFLRAMKNNHVYKEGTGMVVGSLGSRGRYALGTICISEKGLEFAEDEGEAEILAILRILEKLKQGNIKQKIRETFPNGYAEEEFSIMNYKTDTEREKIGYIEQDKISLTGSIVFPGNVSSIPTSKPVIPLSAETGIYNYDGTTSLEMKTVYFGALIMLDLLNNDPSYLPNFQLQMYQTDCGPKYNQDHYMDCFSRHKPNLGHYSIISPYDDMILGGIDTYRRLGTKIPIIGFLNRNKKLYNKEEFPEYIIPSASSIYTASILPNILQAFRWMNIILFGSSGFQYEDYELFVQRAEDMSINILNKAEYRLFKDSYTLSQFEEYKAHFKHALDTKGSIVVILSGAPVNLYIIQGLYDIGFRPGEVQLFVNFRLTELVNSQSQNGMNMENVIELASGSLTIYNSEWVGEYGEWLESIVAQAVAPLGTGYMCFPIDSLLLGAYAIQTMMELGHEYEDPLKLNQFIRQEKFTGCSGIVSIDGSSNGRSILSYSINNFYNDTKTNELVERVIGNYTIGVSIPLVISKEIVWPKGHSEPMPDIRPDPECGIPEILLRELPESKDVSLFIFVGTLSLSFVVILVLSYRYWWYKSAVLQIPVHMTFEDAAFMLGFVIEAVQIVTIAPYSSQFPGVLLELMNMTVLEIELEITDYWYMFILVVTTATAWSTCVIILFLIGTDCFSKKLKEFLKLIGIRLLPYISVWSYIPILRTLFSIYQCEIASGSDLTDALFDKDCYMNCWKGTHLACAVIVAIVVTVYISMSALSRLFWDEYSDYSYIKTNTCFCLLKGPSYACLAGLSVLFKSESFYSFVFCGIFGTVAISSFFTSPTNYKRMNLWVRIGNIGIVWVIGVNILGNGLPSFATVGLQVGGLGVLGGIGLFIQYKFFKSMLYRTRAVRVYDLFRFGLAGKISKEEINEKIRRMKEKQSITHMKYAMNEDIKEKINKRCISH